MERLPWSTVVLLILSSVSLALADDSVVPSWFYTDVSFCFYYWADGDVGQCNSGMPWNSLTSGPTCAVPNTKTMEYRDDTDKRSGGCNYQWALNAPVSQPDAKVLAGARLCFRYRADGDRGQCGDHLGLKTVCQNVGDYTDFYRDDTDGRPGGCQMSWKIEVPGVTPAWLKRVQLCMYWRPDGNAQCSGPSSPICANINQWTPEYRDDTDERAGGCRMAWSLVVT